MDADNRAAQALLVGSHAGGQIGERRLVAKLATQRLACRVELATLTPDAARPGITAQRVDHRAADAPLGKRFELDAAIFVKAAGRIDQTKHAVLHQVADVDGVGH